MTGRHLLKSWQVRVVLGCSLLATLLAPVSALDTAQDPPADRDCEAWAGATAPLTPGSPLITDEIVLTRSDGSVAMTVPFVQPAQVSPGSLDGKALIRSLGGEYGVLDLESGEVVMLAFPGSEPGAVSDRSFQFLDSSGRRFHLFGDPARLTAYLVDLETGETLALADLLDEPGPITSGAVSVDDRWLTFFDGRVAYLVDLTASGQAVAVEEELRTRNAMFTSDGASIIYLRETDVPQTEIVKRNLESGEERVIGQVAIWEGAWLLPGDILVAHADGQLFRVPMDGSDPVVLLEASGELAPVTIESTGETLLVRQELNDRNRWRLVRLDGAGVSAIPALDGGFVLAPSEQAGWALFAPSQAPMQGTPGTPYLSLDLRTGAVTTLLTQDGDGIYTAGFNATADGRYQLVQAVSTASGRLWLLDAASGTGTLVAESTGNAAGALTSDGCYLAVGTFDALGEGRQGRVDIFDPATGQVVTTVPDAVLLGWARQ